MKIIEKIHLVNWHYIKYKTIMLSEVSTLITGETGSGKSTVIDALQLVIMGDSKAPYFNKAASEKSKRSLMTYLMGMNNIEESGDKFYLRDGDFSSYVVLQGHDTTKDRRFCIGVIYDVSGATEQINDRQWFYLDRELPADGFVKFGQVQTIANFKENYAFVKKGDMLFETEQEYRHHFCSPRIMGNLRSQDFYSVFRNAVAFKPPSDIKSFIENFIAENETMDIEGMKLNIETYKKMENQIIDMEKQMELLNENNDLYNQYYDLVNKEKAYNYGREKINLIDEQKLFNKFKDEFSSLNDEIMEIEEEKNQLNFKIEKLESDIDVKQAEYSDANSQSDKEKFELRIEALNNELKNIENNEINLRNKINKFLLWQEYLENIDDFDIPYEQESVSIAIKTMESFQSHSFNKEFLQNAKGHLSKLKKDIDSKYHDLKKNEKETSDKIDKLESELTKLQNGLKPYDKTLIDFKKKMEDELLYRCKEKVEVNILAELLEIRDEEWSNAIEGYMHNSKLHLIIDPKYYEDAIEVYNSLDSNIYYGYGIVDIEKIQQLDFKVKNGSLAEEIITENSYARVYVDYLLRGVIKCYNIKDLRNNPISITKECFLYQNFLSSRINKNHYLKNRCIGKLSIVRNIQRLENEIEEETENIKILTENRIKIERYINLKTIGEEYEIDELIRYRDELRTKQGKTDERNELVEKLSNIDLTTIYRLKEELDKLKDEKKAADDQKEDLVETLGSKNGRAENLLTSLIPDKEKYINVIKEEMHGKYNSEFLASNYCTKMDERIENSKNRLAKLTDEMSEELANCTNNKEKKFDLVKSKRKELYSKYGIDKGFDSILNVGYELYHKNLEENNLPQYKEDIKIQKVKAYQQFSNELLCKLKDSINKAIGQKDLLNRSLAKIDFGKDKYTFNIKPALKYKKFYDMIMDESLEEAPIFEYAHKSKYEDVIEELFEKITEKGETIAEQTRVKQNIDIFTNYKTYLDFDMTCTTYNADGSRKVTSITKAFEYNSGGETQNPFYITILSAFQMMYQMDKKSKDETMRLIVFDEAFNKMDGDRVASSILLAKKMGFQLVIVAPSDKIGLIGPNVDEIIHVESVNKEKIIITEFTKKEDIETLVNAGVSDN